MQNSHNNRRNKDFADRVRWAYDVKWKRGRAVTQDEFAAEVVGRLPAGSVSQSKVSRWLAGQEPDFSETTVLAAVLKVDAGWLAFGVASQAPLPEGWEELQPAPRARGHRAMTAAAEAAAKSASKRGKAG